MNTLAKSTYHEILKITTDSESESGQAYTSLKSLFNHTKKVYTIEDHFLSPHELGLVENAQLDTIRKANMATYISSVFGSQDVGFYYLNEYFLDTFVADGNRLLKSQAQLFLDLKTHAYISASSNGKHSREELLEDLFPPDLEDRLLSRRHGAKQLAPSEADFLKRARNRSKSLLDDSRTDEGVALLPEKYIWEDYLRDVRAYVIKNFADIAGIPVGVQSNVFLGIVDVGTRVVNLFAPVGLPISLSRTLSSLSHRKACNPNNWNKRPSKMFCRIRFGPLPRFIIQDMLRSPSIRMTLQKKQLVLHNWQFRAST